MKNILKSYIAPASVALFLLVSMVSSCAKDDYYQDGGKSDPKFNGTVLQYLQSNAKFDTIVQIVKLAGMEEAFNTEDITFFAPTDEVIRRTIGLVNAQLPELRNGLNQRLFNANKDTIKVLSDVPAELWRKYLMRYMMKGKFVSKDFPQLDFTLRQLYGGGYYTGYNGDLANIGMVYNSANGVRYTGYRQLSFSFIPDPSDYLTFIPTAVASSDIQPTNGVVHVLAVHVGRSNIGEAPISFYSNYFGISDQFTQEVILNK